MVHNENSLLYNQSPYSHCQHHNSTIMAPFSTGPLRDLRKQQFHTDRRNITLNPLMIMETVQPLPQWHMCQNIYSTHPPVIYVTKIYSTTSQWHVCQHTYSNPPPVTCVYQNTYSIHPPSDMRAQIHFQPLPQWHMCWDIYSSSPPVIYVPKYIFNPSPVRYMPI